MRKLLLLLILCCPFAAYAQVTDSTAIKVDSSAKTTKMDSSDLKTVPLAIKKDTSYWAKSLKAGANLTQATFSDNWKGGGVNNLSFTTLLNAKADYIKGHSTFRSEIDFQYGAVRNKGEDFRKSLDKLYVDTKYGYAFARAWSVFVSLNFLTQFSQGYEYAKNDSTGETTAAKISQIFAPGYFTQSLGIEYKPADYFFLRFGTGTLRQTFVVDTALYRQVPENYGVPIHKRYRNEFALQLVASFDRDIAQNLNLKARYTGFFNYRTLGEPNTWDHRLEGTLLAKVNRFVSASISSIMIFDQDAAPHAQISYQLGLGLLATFGGVNKN